MRRPSVGSIFWFVAFIAASILLVRQAPFVESKGGRDIRFGDKYFFDNGTGADETGFAQVSITGTLAGDGVSYKNNTTTISCRLHDRECLVSSIEQIGPNQLGRLDSPGAYPIVKWDGYEIVAIEDVGDYHCRKTTISLERKLKTAVWVEEPIDQSRAGC